MWFQLVVLIPRNYWPRKFDLRNVESSQPAYGQHPADSAIHYSSAAKVTDGYVKIFSARRESFERCSRPVTQDRICMGVANMEARIVCVKIQREEEKDLRYIQETCVPYHQPRLQ